MKLPESIERRRSEDVDFGEANDRSEDVDFEEATERSEESGAEEHADEIKATGFALMKSAAFLSAELGSAKNCIDCVPLSTMRGACAREDS